MAATLRRVRSLVIAPERRVVTVLSFVFALALPMISFPLGVGFELDWQTGKVLDRVGLFLTPDVTRYFAPLIILAWLATLAVIPFESRLRGHRWVRYAVYTGVPLTLHFLAISAVVLRGVPLAAGVSLILILLGCIALKDRLGWETPRGSGIAAGAIVILAVIGAAVLALGSGVDDAGVFVDVVLGAAGIVALWILFAGPVLCFVISLHRSSRLWVLERGRRQAETDERQRVEQALTAAPVAAATAWTVAYGWSWRGAYLEALENYRALPTEPPGCYLATVAATGDPGVVGSWTVETACGAQFPATRQLPVFKAAEVALFTGAPRLHREIRRAYDLLGPRLAARVTSSRRAHLTYAALKPSEWLVDGVLALLAPGVRSIRSRLYR